ncbi:molecular chaperone [uncultured Photobacterium sp.]|uniref:TorD/DmsD family molecular chaperone n=1 Tax=uncultured Photobacterium sp. TaxID=173973 RepID=UPI00261A663F|nr:molecular chaperone TorD family protein [uncultured Photobacterium sp.]
MAAQKKILMMINIKYLELRSHTYGLFAGLISQPINEITWQQLNQWAKRAGKCGFLTPMQTWIIKNEKLPNNGLTHMAVDYARLFTGIAQEYGPPPPYEHLYRENLEPSSCRTAVIQCYKNSNVKPFDPYHNVSDHIVSELQYMSTLSLKQIHSDNLLSNMKRDENKIVILISEQQSFLQHHLLSWVHLWRNRIREQKNNLSFYSYMIDALVCFIEQDLKYLGDNNTAHGKT